MGTEIQHHSTSGIPIWQGQVHQQSLEVTQTFKVSTGCYFVSHLLSIRFHNFGCNGCVMSKPAEIQFGPWWKICSKPFTCHSLQRFSSGAADHTFHLPTCNDLNVGCRNELLGQLLWRMHSGPNEADRSGTRSGSYFGTTCKVHQGATSQGTLKGQCQSLSRAQKFRSVWAIWCYLFRSFSLASSATLLESCRSCLSCGSNKRPGLLKRCVPYMVGYPKSCCQSTL